MRNEKQFPASRPTHRMLRNYWQGSLLLLMFPTFHGDWAVHFPVKGGDEPALAAIALPNAHAHNDYLHEKPLAEALSQGFTSVEADVHLVNGELYLGHWLPQMFPAKTLREVYLEPLHALLACQKGKIYPGFKGVFYLMIDVKTDSLATWTVLRRQLLQYPVFQCNPHFQVFISGNRATCHIQNDPEQVAAVDGCLPDLNQAIDASVMPVISDNFRQHFKWRGKGSMPAHEKQKLKALAGKAHHQGKKLRFWGIPDQPNAWSALLDAGVDLISTDDLTGAGSFLAKRMQSVEIQIDKYDPILSETVLTHTSEEIPAKMR
ncbi:MAG: hypothetical protein DYG98_18630 [Haliscomenobacteraceae bacterium CHB4]|nr:hypothetical protein [Haliscomenobacteraceae bacterium CHB4]